MATKSCDLCQAVWEVGQPSKCTCTHDDCMFVPKVASSEEQRDAARMVDLLLRVEDAIEALDGTSIENEKLVDDYRAWKASFTTPKDPHA